MNGRLNEKKKLMVHVYDRDMEPLISLHSEIYYNVWYGKGKKENEGVEEDEAPCI